jgi:hypothetical protein
MDFAYINVSIHSYETVAISLILKQRNRNHQENVLFDFCCIISGHCEKKKGIIQTVNLEQRKHMRLHVVTMSLKLFGCSAHMNPNALFFFKLQHEQESR